MVAMTHRHLNLAGIVLAGGRSRRMGRDKASMDWDGRPLLSTVVDVVAQRCDPVLVTAAQTSQAYVELGQADGLTWITTEEIGTGPLGGLVVALEAAEAAGSPAAFVCATDMPLIEPELIDELLRGLTVSTDAVIAYDSERAHPMAGIYRTRVAPRLAELLATGEQRMTAALDAIVTHRVTVSNPDWLTNVDAPEDVHRLRTA
ncbi:MULTISPECIES: molybdenum cofactor guanylyltransferase [unclassified Gordonia (in: high G+C Gram-positive bacteria)]|uniref:molybdenum cofactor guanylyltransferase n=1 Tax=unclassified Gordonia (in: high G+C Gram-positive bacteria) TaxID=2657482 RepID=UPI001FFEF4C6|nr:molybdenum cofactor guanylyltransferase [Gordonia sp. PP30]UQE77002.1 molybdenum cofactor guanylyltransferase [Gordonia sp. PP30]